MFSAQAQTVSDFETVLSGNDTIWNGSDQSGGFVDGAAYFFNDYNTDWGSWSGFSVSKTTDTLAQNWSNQYASISGAGAHNSSAYSTLYSESTVMFTHSANGDSLYGLMINNSTYTYLTLLNGDNFAKKFGGASGNDPDFYTATFYGYDANLELTDSVVFYLADYRDANNANDYIVKDWTWVDLKKLGKIRYLDIAFNSTDKGQFGINTPTYACIDSLVYNNSSNQFQPLAAYLYKRVGFNAAPRNFNTLEFAVNPGSSLDSLTTSIVVHPSNGTANVLSDSIVSYEPDNGFNGVDSVWFSLCNQHGLCDTGLIQIIANDAPIANIDTLTYGSDGVVTIDVLANDVDEKKTDLSISLLDTAKNGKASVVNKEVEYISNNGFLGQDTLSYLVCDLFGECDTGFMYITIKNEVGLEYQVLNQIKVYPNPTNGLLTIDGINKSTQITLTDINGQIMSLQVNGNVVSIEELKAGIYFMNLQSEGNLQVQRIIKN